MSTLGRWWRWLQPGLLYVEPMFAIAYFELMDSIESSPREPEISGAVESRGRNTERHERPRRLLGDRL
jgi:hypothetical protein